MSYELKKLRAPIAALATFAALVWGGVLTKAVVLNAPKDEATSVAQATTTERRPRAASPAGTTAAPARTSPSTAKPAARSARG